MKYQGLCQVLRKSEKYIVPPCAHRACGHTTCDRSPLVRGEKKLEGLFTQLPVWPRYPITLIGEHLFTQTELPKVLSHRHTN